MIKEHSESLKHHLRAGEQWTRIMFSLLCAERLRPCCWAFAKEYDCDVSGFQLGCERVFGYLLTQNLSQDLESLIEGYAATIHTSEEYGGPLAVQAQYGMMALANTLELCRADDVQRAAESGSHVVDAIDNFELFAWKSVLGSGDFVEDKSYWLLSTELERQVRQAIDLSRLKRHDMPKLLIENRQYAIPPAVL